MANTKSAKKAARQTIRRTDVNKARRTRLRSSVRKVEEAIASGNKEAAAAALKEAEPVIARTGAARRGPSQDGIAQSLPSRQARRRHGQRPNKKTSPVVLRQQRARAECAPIMSIQRIFQPLVAGRDAAAAHAAISRVPFAKKNRAAMLSSKPTVINAAVPSPASESGLRDRGLAITVGSSVDRLFALASTRAPRLISGCAMCIVQSSERGVPLLHN